MNTTWQCYLCGTEEDFQYEAAGYLGNYHPLCLSCSNDIYHNHDHEDRFRLTYHEEYGELLFLENDLKTVRNN